MPAIPLAAPDTAADRRPWPEAALLILGFCGGAWAALLTLAAALLS